MKYTTADRMIQKLSRATLVAGLAAAVVAVPMATVGGMHSAMAATSGGSKVPVTVNVNRINLGITQVNDFTFDGNISADNVAVKTYEAKNEVHFTTDQDAHVQIILDGDVIWEGDTKAGQPVTVTVDLGGRPLGVYQLIMHVAPTDGSSDGYDEGSFWLDYQATVPSIINAPNTGLYVNIGGRIYSMTTIAFVLLMLGIVVFLACTRQSNKEMAKAKARAKSNRKKMDMI